eukprot:818939-Rhodomonas_salina.1
MAQQAFQTDSAHSSLPEGVRTQRKVFLTEAMGVRLWQGPPAGMGGQESGALQEMRRDASSLSLSEASSSTPRTKGRAVSRPSPDCVDVCGSVCVRESVSVVCVSLSEASSSTPPRTKGRA